MRHDKGYLDSFTTGRISPDAIENGILEGRRLRAVAMRSAFNKVISGVRSGHNNPF